MFRVSGGASGLVFRRFVTGGHVLTPRFLRRLGRLSLDDRSLKDSVTRSRRGNCYRKAAGS